MKKFKYIAMFLVGVISLPTYGLENNDKIQPLIPLNETIESNPLENKLEDTNKDEERLQEFLMGYEQLIKEERLSLVTLTQISIEFLKESMLGGASEWLIEKGIWTAEQVNNFDPTNKDGHKKMVEQVITYAFNMKQENNTSSNSNDHTDVGVDDDMNIEVNTVTNTSTDSDGNADTDTSTDSDGNADTDTSTDSDGNADTDTSTDSDDHTDTDTSADSDENTDTSANSDTNTADATTESSEEVVVSTKPLEEIDYFEAVPMGQVVESELQLSWGDDKYPLYYYNYTNFISTDVLEVLGFKLVEDELGIYVVYEPQQESNVTGQEVVEDQDIPEEVLDDVAMNNKRLYIGNCLTYSLKAGDTYLIPIRSLNDYFTFNVQEGLCVLNKQDKSTTEYVQLKGNHILNRSIEAISVEITHTYINEDGIIEEVVQKLQLQGNQEASIEYAIEGRQINSLVTKVEVLNQLGIQETVAEVTLGQYGQDKITWEPMYNKNAIVYDKEALEQLFPESKIIGTMKYATNGIEKGEKVEVARAQDGYCYYVYKDGKEIKIPWNSITIPKNPPVCTARATTAQLEAYINQREITSDTDYLVWTDIYRQRTYVFIDEAGQWKLHRDMLCTTGNNITPTPRGMYKLRAYVPYFGLDKGYMCKDAVQIFGDYLYHSLMMDPTGSYVLGSNGPLGRQASHGCIRLSVDDANWFYSTLPLKTTVWIN